MESINTSVAQQPKRDPTGQAASLPDGNTSRFSSGGFVSSMTMTIAYPCVPVAQVASAAGLSYVAALALFGVLYVAACASYAVAARMEDTFVEGTSVFSAYAGQTVAFIGGPLVTLIVAFYKYSNERWPSGMGTAVTDVGELNEELNGKMTVSAASVSLVITMILLNLMFATEILHLRSLLNRRVKLDARDESGCRTIATVVCCASCSLFEMVWTVKGETGTPPFHLGPIDEIPAFSDEIVAVAREDAAAVV